MTERDENTNERGGVVGLAKAHRAATGHQFHGIDPSYAPCRECEFVAERQGPLGVVTVTE